MDSARLGAAASAEIVALHTEEHDFAGNSDHNTTNPGPDRCRHGAEKRPSRVRYRAETGVTTQRPGALGRMRQTSLGKNPRKGHQPMTFRSRIALGVSAAVVSLGLALAPAAFAQDKMSND